MIVGRQETKQQMMTCLCLVIMIRRGRDTNELEICILIGVVAEQRHIVVFPSYVYLHFHFKHEYGN